jgi:hypothetical protein
MLDCRVYAKHRSRSDTFIGGTSGTIESLLAEGAAGGQRHIIYHSYALTIPQLPAITRDLCKYDVHGNQRKTQTIVEFTIVATSRVSNAAELNMGVAVTQVNDELDRMKPIQTSFEPIQEVVDTSATLMNDIKSLSDTWGPLLQKIRLFSELVDTIAEVSYQTRLA